jgi:hypothetical protein
MKQKKKKLNNTFIKLKTSDRLRSNIFVINEHVSVRMETDESKRTSKIKNK